MKKLAALTLALLLLTCAAQADSVHARLNQRISTRTGPGTEYFEPGTFLKGGDYVTVHTKVWDARNEIWWVQVEFTAGGDTYRAYTGSWRMEADLRNVPQERALRTCYLTADADVFAGPGWQYVMWNDTVYRGTSALLLEVENGYGHIECWNSQKNMYWRVWADLDDLSCGRLYTDWDDTYPSYSGSYDDGDGAPDSGADWDHGAAQFPVGETCMIIAESGNARSGAGTEYPKVAYVARWQTYTIFDTAKASNGRTWYQIWVDGRYAWISSGIASIDGRIYD